MKKLVFIDNDEDKRDFRLVCDILEDNSIEAKFDSKIFNFHKLNREEAFKIVFNPENILVTWSMYTSDHFNSRGQFLNLLRAAARNGVSGLTYICTTGYVLESLNSEVRNDKNVVSLLCGIETNTILCKDKEGVLKRVRVKIGNMCSDFFVLEDFDTSKLF